MARHRVAEGRQRESFLAKFSCQEYNPFIAFPFLMRMKRFTGLLSVLTSLDGAARASPVRQQQHHGQATSSNTPIITGLFGTPSTDARIVVHDTAGQAAWTWTFADARNVSDALRRCVHDVCSGGGCDVPEVKWAEGGDSIVSVYGFAVLVVNHHPGRASDKQISFGVCTDRDDMGNTHSAELLPDGNVAVATTTAAGTGNIKVFDRAVGAEDARAAPVQQLHGIPAVHAVLWDPRRRVLWAAGNNVSPLAEGSRSILNAYAYSQPQPQARGRFQTTTAQTTAVLADAVHLTAEWGSQTPWWDGSHAMVPVPGQDKLLVTTDLDVHLYDIEARTVEHGLPVAERYLAGFQPAGARVGVDGVALPRSDIKSLSMLANGDTLYVQAVWNQTYGENVALLANGGLRARMWNQRLYRSRWFTETVW